MVRKEQSFGPVVAQFLQSWQVASSLFAEEAHCRCFWREFPKEEITFCVLQRLVGARLLQTIGSAPTDGNKLRSTQ